MSKTIRLNSAFYLRTDVVQLSKELLGKVLVTNFNNQLSSGMIVETEAYRAPDDKACHAFQNKKTKRTKTMFEAGGHTYVYLCYGIHHLFNVVTGPPDVAHAVLIRAIEPLENIKLMLKRRGQDSIKPQLSAGPGVMSKAMGITTIHNEIDMSSAQSPIWIEDRNINIEPKQIIESPRVGVAYAEECALWNWRFRIKGNRFTSKAK